MDTTDPLNNNRDIHLTLIKDGPYVFGRPKLEFEARWVDDASTDVCLLCDSRFTQVRRKHHCRSCGRLICSKCCGGKIFLKHFGLTKESRVCVKCKPYQVIITKLLEGELIVQLEELKKLEELFKSDDRFYEIVELGILDILVWLCQVESTELYIGLVPCLCRLVSDASLHSHLISAGVVRCIDRMLSVLNPSDKLVKEIVGMLLILASRSSNIGPVVCEGGVTLLLKLLLKVIQTTQVIVLQAIAKMCASPAAHTVIMCDTFMFRQMILLCKRSLDKQVCGVILCILSEISAGSSSSYKERLAEEEFTFGFLAENLKPELPEEVTLYSCCLTANLASEEKSQMYIWQLIPKLQALVGDPSAAFYTHVIRALANFSMFAQHSKMLVTFIPDIITALQKTTDLDVRNQSVRLITTLLSDSFTEAYQQLLTSDLQLFLSKLLELPGIASSLTSTIEKCTDRVRRPL